MSNNDKFFLEEITDIDSVDFIEEPKAEVTDIFGDLGEILNPGKSGIESLQELAESSEARLENQQLICNNCGCDVEVGNSSITNYPEGEGRLCRKCYHEFYNDEEKPEKEERNEDLDEPYGNLNN